MRRSGGEPEVGGARCGRLLALASILALMGLLALPGRGSDPGAGGPEKRVRGPDGRPERVPLEPESEAFARLRAGFASAAGPDETGRRERAEAQVEAVHGHLCRYPATRYPRLLFSWLTTIELDVLERPEAALRALDAWERAGDAGDAGSRGIRLRLRARVLQALGDRKAEAAVLRRLAGWVGGAERRLLEARLDQLGRLAVGRRLPPVGGRTLQGGTVGPRTWKGRVLLLVLWDPTANEAPHTAREIEELRRASDSSELVVIGVPLTRDLDATRAALAHLGVEWAQVFDPRRPGNDHPVAGCLSPGGRPARFLVDRSETIRGRDQRGRALRCAVAELLTESGPPVSRPDA